MTSPDSFSILSLLMHKTSARTMVPAARLLSAPLLAQPPHFPIALVPSPGPAFQALTYYTFHHRTLEHLVMLAIFLGPVFCLLSTLMHKQQESESRSSFDHCCPGLSTLHAERAVEKLQKETSSPYPHFPTSLFSPADSVVVAHALCFACLSSLSACPCNISHMPYPHRLIPWVKSSQTPCLILAGSHCLCSLPPVPS